MNKLFTFYMYLIIILMAVTKQPYYTIGGFITACVCLINYGSILNFFKDLLDKWK